MPVDGGQSSVQADTAVTEPSSPTGTVDTIADNVSHDRGGELIPLVERLTEELQGLRADFDAKIRYDEVKEQQIKAMHDELQTLRAGVHLRMLHSIFTDLIAMHDDLTDALNADDTALDAGSAGQPAKILGSLKESVAETLSRNGVSSYSVESDELDKARQRVIDTVHTTDPTLHQQVVRRLRVGFEYDSKVLRPEWVVAHRHVAPQDPA